MIGVTRVIVFLSYLGASVMVLQACGTMTLPQEAGGAAMRPMSAALPEVLQQETNLALGADVNTGVVTTTTPRPATVDVMGTEVKTRTPPSSLVAVAVEPTGQQPPSDAGPPAQQAENTENETPALEAVSVPSPDPLPSRQSTRVAAPAEDSAPESKPGKIQKLAITAESTRAASEDEIKYVLANRYFNAGRYQNTIDVLETNGSDKNTTAKSRDLLVMAYIEYANKLTAKSEMSEALVLLDKANSIQPGNKRISEQLAKIKNYLESNRVYQTALEKYNSGQKQEAFTLFHRVLQLNPQHSKASAYYTELKADVVDQHHKKALQFYRKQQLKEAIQEWDELLVLDPTNDMAKIYRSRAVELKSKIEKL